MRLLRFIRVFLSELILFLLVLLFECLKLILHHSEPLVGLFLLFLDTFFLFQVLLECLLQFLHLEFESGDFFFGSCLLDLVLLSSFVRVTVALVFSLFRLARLLRLASKAGLGTG